MPLAPSELLKDRYRIVKLLGQGGFGAVYRAWDISLDRPCAVKENLDTSLQAQRQFEREAKILANLEHPNLPRVTDYFFIANQGQYLVMDFVEGDDLGQMLNRSGKPLPEAQVLPWMMQTCDALIYLHAQNPPVIHRDIKPTNIKITPDNTVKLVDFGIAKVYDPRLSTTMGARAVTPGFSPPEQYGLGKTDARADEYALGATLCSLLTGQEPPESIQRSTGPISDIPGLTNPAISTITRSVILKAMQIVPDRRFQSVREFKAALNEAFASPGQPVRVMPQGRAPVAQPSMMVPGTAPRSRSCGWVTAIGAFALLTILGFVVLAMILFYAGKNSDSAALPTPIPSLETIPEKSPSATKIEALASQPATIITLQPSLTPELVTQLFDGDARKFENPPTTIIYANTQHTAPPNGVSIADSGNLWRYYQWIALMEAQAWIEVRNTGMNVTAMSVQFWGDTNDGWARVLLDGEEVWQGSIYGSGPSAPDLYSKYLEVSGLAPGVHVLRVESFGLPGRGGGDDVCVYFFGFK
ncbi:MAG: protein kinase [Anaerolineales bacterium]|nr:protein kinase [Anaerolineales bacterium]